MEMIKICSFQDIQTHTGGYFFLWLVYFYFWIIFWNTKLYFFHLEQRIKQRHLLISVVSISVSFLCLSSPFVWNTFRQLTMNYNPKLVTEARNSAMGALFNYEHHIVLFILSINNCINFYIYLLSGSTWRTIFLDYLRSVFCRCKSENNSWRRKIWIYCI